MLGRKLNKKTNQKPNTKKKHAQNVIKAMSKTWELNSK